jgi:hypothetical protein
MPAGLKYMHGRSARGIYLVHSAQELGWSGHHHFRQAMPGLCLSSQQVAAAGSGACLLLLYE